MTLPDIPTALTYKEACILHKLAKGRRVIEFGSLLGFSTIILAQSAELVIAVDPHEGYPKENPRPTLSAFRHHLKVYQVDEKVIPILSTGQRVWPLLRSMDLAFIDMDSIVDELLPTVFEHCSVVCVHDYGHDKWTGATEAVRKFLGTHPDKVVCKIEDTLAILSHT
jgi:predicted O-methyltransferase YrrM